MEGPDSVNDHDPPLICPNSECGEEMDKEDDGSYPLCCYICGTHLPNLSPKCPDCHTKRRKSKKTGAYGNFCTKCTYSYVTRESSASMIASRQQSVPGATPPGGTHETPTPPAVTPSAVTPPADTPPVAIPVQQTTAVATHPTTEQTFSTDKPMPLDENKGNYNNQSNTSPHNERSNAESSSKVPVQETEQQCRNDGTGMTDEQPQFGPQGNIEGRMNQDARKRKSSAAKNGQREKIEDKMVTSKTPTYAEKAAESKPSQTTKPTGRSKKVPQPNDENFINNVYDLFTELKKTIDQVTDDIDRTTDITCLSDSQRKDIRKCSHKATSLEMEYQKEIAQLRRAATEKEKSKRQRTVDQSLHGMERFLTKWSDGDLSTVVQHIDEQRSPVHSAHNEGSPETSVLSSSSVKDNASKCRRVQFWAVLPERALKYFRGKAIDPILEIRTNTGHFEWNRGPPLLVLKKCADGLWKGECQSISKRTTQMEFKYCIRGKPGHDERMWEILHNKGNRHVNFPSDEDFTVYDGTILMDTEKGIVRSFTDYFSAADSKERKAGCSKMLPQLTEELQKGTTLVALKKWIENVATHQTAAFSGFAVVPNTLRQDDISTVIAIHFAIEDVHYLF